MSNTEVEIKRVVLGLVKVQSGKITTKEVRELIMNEYAYTSKQAHNLIQELFKAGFMTVAMNPEKSFDMVLSYGYEKDAVIEEMLRQVAPKVVHNEQAAI